MSALSLTVSPVTAHGTSDGKTFPTRDEALAHQKSLVRIERLSALQFDTSEFAVTDDDSASPSQVFVRIEDVPALLAEFGDAIYAALEVKQGRGPKKVVAPAPAVPGAVPPLSGSSSCAIPGGTNTGTVFQ